MVIDVLHDVAPTLVAPSAEVVTDVPTSGKDIAFTQVASVTLSNSGIKNDECYIVQSLDELKAFYGADEDCEDYTASFSEEFFRTNVLVLVKVCASNSLRITDIIQIRCDGHVLKVHLIEEYLIGDRPSVNGERILLSVAKADVANVTAIRVYEEREIHYELL